MEKEANYFAVGVFVSLSLLALVGFSIWVAGVHDFDRHTRYTVYFTDPVSGLDQQATVKYKGVEVGKILAMRLSPDRSDLVKVDIEIKESTPVSASTIANIASEGITGQTYIDLDTPNNDKSPPPRMESENYPVLKGTGSRFAKLLDSMPRISSQFQSTLSNIVDLSKEGAKMADSIRGLADKLKQNPSQILSSPEQQHKGVEIPK